MPSRVGAGPHRGVAFDIYACLLLPRQPRPTTLCHSERSEESLSLLPRISFSGRQILCHSDEERSFTSFRMTGGVGILSEWEYPLGREGTEALHYDRRGNAERARRLSNTTGDSGGRVLTERGSCATVSIKN